MTFIESQLNSENLQSTPLQNQRKQTKISTIFNLKNIAYAASILIISSVPFLVYFIEYNEGNFDKFADEHSCLVERIDRIPCGNDSINQKECRNVLCCFEPSTNSCFHTDPSYYNYKYEEESRKFVPSQKLTPLGLQSSEQLEISAKSTKNYLKIVLSRKESEFHDSSSDFTDFDVVRNEKELSFSVFRKDTEELILTTTQGPLISSKSYVEWSLQLSDRGNNSVLFGLGQLKITLNENTTLTRTIYKNQNDHNTLPMFMAHNNGKYHAVVVKNSGVLELKVLPSYTIFLKSVSDDDLEIQVYDGPFPKEIYAKLMEENYAANENLPEWSLGVHLCRENPGDSLDDVMGQYEAFLEEFNEFPFDYESECVHDDLLLHILAENLTNSEVRNLFGNLNLKKKFMLSYPPQVPVYSTIFENYKDKNVFFKNDDGKIYTGIYKKIDVAFPNYQSEVINDFLNEIKDLFKGISIDGIVFTNTWPQDESYIFDSSKNYSIIDKNIAEAFSHTLPYFLQEDSSIHLKFHNEYGTSVRQKVEAIFSPQFSLSPSSNFNQNRFLIQNINTTWVDLKNSLSRTLSNSLFGFSLISVPICGSTEFYDKESNEDLCMRWYLFAGTMPLARISSSNYTRDPANLNTKYSSKKAVEVLDKRRKFVPYFRSILSSNQPLVRPMFYNYPSENVQELDEQYMVGDAILVAQPMTSDVQSVNVYLPAGKNWFEFWGGSKYATKKGDEFVKIPIVKSDWISFILEGTIVPQVTYDTEGGATKIDLIIAEKCADTCTAEGSAILNLNGVDVAVDFTWTDGTLNLNTTSDMKETIGKMVGEMVLYS